MASCVVCKLPCGDESDLKCSVCDGVFHAKCAKVEVEGKKVLRSAKDWKCKDCKLQSSRGSVVSAASGPSSISREFKDFMVHVLDEFKNEVFNELKSLRSELVDLTKSVQFVSDKLDASNLLMEDMKSQFSDLQRENLELKVSNAALSSEMCELREKVRNIEQYSRRNNVEVSGIPTTPGENVAELVRDVGSALGIEVKDSDVSAAHRVPAYRKDRLPALIIQFHCRSMKNAWISSFREKKMLNSQQINARFPATSRIYVNDHLSPDNKKFLGKLKERCREVGYSFAWCRDEKFFVRKAQGDSVKRINTEKDIANLK